jgi:hypothetical protein
MQTYKLQKYTMPHILNKINGGCFEFFLLWVLRRVFGPKRGEVTGKSRKLHNEELNDLYSLRNIVRVVKSRTMRWAGMWRVWWR